VLSLLRRWFAAVLGFILGALLMWLMGSLSVSYVHQPAVVEGVGVIGTHTAWSLRYEPLPPEPAEPIDLFEDAR